MTNRLRITVNSTVGAASVAVETAERDADALLRELCAVRTFVTAPLYPLPIAPRTSLERLIASAVKGLLTGSVVEVSWTGDAGFIFSVEAEVAVGQLAVRTSLGLTRLATEVWANGVRRFVRTTNPDMSLLPIEELALSLTAASVDVALAALKAWQSGGCVVTRVLGSQVRVCPGTEASPKATPQAVPFTAIAAPALA